MPDSMPDPAATAALAAERVLILDFGSQVTQLIARRLRESGVYCEIWPFNVDAERIAAWRPRGIILSGGPASLTEGASPRAPQAVFEAGVPLLGICYGMQAMCDQLGGEVQGSDHREFGRAFVDLVDDCVLFQGVWHKGGREQVWMSHGDRVTRLPSGFRAVGVSDGAPFAAIADDTRRFYGLLFHPEVVHTPHGAALLRNFTHGVLGLSGTWTMAGFRATEIARVRAEVGQGRVICGLSGGVDSSVAAVLIHEAIGDQLTCIFVDHGLLRQDEAEEVVTTFRDRFNIRLVHCDASELFLGALEGVTDPEVKRKTIGRLFIDVFEEEARKLGRRRLAGAGHAVSGCDRERQFHRRAIGDDQVASQCWRAAGADADEAGGAAARAVQGRGARAGTGAGSSRGDRRAASVSWAGAGDPGAWRDHAREAGVAARADAIFLEEIRAAGLYDAIWQAFAVLLPVRTVGVMGDGRTYDHACALRAVTSTDGMTADVYPFDAAFLTRVAGRIVNEVRGINRVTYDITSKPPGTIEWE